MTWRRWLSLETERLADVRAVSVLTIVAVVLIWVTWLLLLWGMFPRFEQLERATRGFLQFTLIAGALGAALQLAAIVGLGHLRLRDVGLRGRQMLAGLVLVALMWLVAQGMLAGAAVATGHEVVLSAPRPERLGDLVAQLAGNALHEEIAARGFLLVQLALLVRRWTVPRTAWLVAIVISQLIFALMHIPQRWVNHDMHGLLLLENLAFLWWYGVVYAVIYLRTANLGVCIALHALSNVPVVLVVSPMRLGLAVDILTVVLLVAWPILARRMPALAIDARAGASTKRD